VKIRMTIAVLLAAAVSASAQPADFEARFLGGQTPEEVLKAAGPMTEVPPFVEPALNVGDNAPALAVTAFPKGEAITSFEQGKVYLIDFWASWCGPCIRSFPHLTELQEKYANDGLRVVAVNIWESERTPEGPKPVLGEARTELVANFLKTHNDNMRYTVAIDGDQAMEQSWMAASGQQGIPTAIIVDRDGKVAWIGYGSDPDMDASLSAVIAGEHNLAETRDQRLDVMRTEHEMRGLNAYFMAIGNSMQRGDVVQGRALIAALYKTHLNDKPDVLNSLAWNLVSQSPQADADDATLSKIMATRAAELTEWKNADILDTLAWALHHLHEHDESIRIQTLAVEHADSEDQREAFADNLEFFKKAAEHH